MADYRRWTSADEAELVQLAQQGLSRVEIARRLGRTVGSVETRASKRGIKMAGSALSVAEGAPRLRKYFEALPYGKRTGRVAYVFDQSAMPRPSTGAEWAEDKHFKAATAILAEPTLKAIFATALKKGCAVTEEK